MTFCTLRKTCHHLRATINTALLPFSQRSSPLAAPVLAPDSFYPTRAYPRYSCRALALTFCLCKRKKKKKHPECAVHCEDSQLLKHHSCTVAEDAAGKVPRHWIPPLPQKPQTLHIMPAIERKRGEERRRRGAARRGRDEKKEKIRECRGEVEESKDRRRYGREGKPGAPWPAAKTSKGLTS